tara:strand:+ start:18147 stop:18470 length:324 start_codon:yes stop_codon:yes gene_type:complete
VQKNKSAHIYSISGDLQMLNKDLKKFVLKEIAKLQKENMSGKLEDVKKAAADVEEIDASEYATALEKDIDFMKALDIKEANLIKKLRQINEAKNKLRSRILKNIDKE